MGYCTWQRRARAWVVVNGDAIIAEAFAPIRFLLLAPSGKNARTGLPEDILPWPSRLASSPPLPKSSSFFGVPPWWRTRARYNHPNPTEASTPNLRTRPERDACSGNRSSGGPCAQDEGAKYRRASERDRAYAIAVVSHGIASAISATVDPSLARRRRPATNFFTNMPASPPPSSLLSSLSCSRRPCRSQRISLPPLGTLQSLDHACIDAPLQAAAAALYWTSIADFVPAAEKRKGDRYIARARQALAYSQSNSSFIK